MTTPLNDLIKKGSFSWNEKAWQDFEKLKEVMSSHPVLTILDFSFPFELECDASREGIGVVNAKQTSYSLKKYKIIGNQKDLFHIWQGDASNHACFS